MNSLPSLVERCVKGDYRSVGIECQTNQITSSVTDNAMVGRWRGNVGGHAEGQINDGALDSFKKSAKKINGKRKKKSHTKQIKEGKQEN